MVKKVVGYIKLQVKVGQVNFLLLVGFVLGQCGLNIMEFCKVFNVVMQKLELGLLVLVIIMVYLDCIFIFIIKSILVVVLFKKVVGIFLGFKCLNIDKVGKVICKQLEEIVKIKEVDLMVVDLDVVVCMIVGFVCFMGFVVEG